MMQLMNWLSSSLRKEEGQGLAEYALILALIAVIAIAALVFLGTQIRTILSTIGAAI
jgi:pilus assembly protein Flp/PilA